jgi:hypothetical protein
VRQIFRIASKEACARRSTQFEVPQSSHEYRRVSLLVALQDRHQRQPTMRQDKPNKIYNAKIAIAAGDSFRKHAHIFLATLGSDINVANLRAAQDIGGLISSATTLALAVELYLKAHRIIARLPVLETHHLWTLYKTLPVSLKNIIERNYDKQNPVDGNDSCALVVVVDTDLTDKDEFNKWKERKASPDTDNSLKGVLLRSSDAFVSWRYVHEQRNDPKLVELTYEYLRLDLIAHLLRDVAVKVLEKRLAKAATSATTET